MAEYSAQELRDAASEEHRRGDVESAVAVYERIIALYPEMFYLSSIGKWKHRRLAERRPASIEAQTIRKPIEKPQG